MGIRPEVVPFLPVAVLAGALVAGLVAASGVGRVGTGALGALAALLLAGGLLFFFRDPARTVPMDSSLIVSGADGVVARIVEVSENEFLNAPCVRVSVFLGLLDVHVNRAPMAGRVTFARYYPGKKAVAFKDEASRSNQHSSIVIEGRRTSCVVNQIVGAVARRVVYWLDVGQDVAMGQRIGMMKFGSRLDIYLPAKDVSLKVKEGDRVVAGETTIAALKGE